MTRIATALAAVLAGLVIASCGGDDGDPIPTGRAERLESLLREAQRQSDRGQCRELRATAADLQREARRLPRSVGEDTRTTIRDGVAHLRDLAESDCTEQRDEPEETTTEETTTEEETTPTTTPETVPTTPETEPTTPDTTETETTPTEPPPTAPQPPDDGGNGGVTPDPGSGNGNGNGGTPPGQEKKGGKDK